MSDTKHTAEDPFYTDDFILFHNSVEMYDEDNPISADQLCEYLNKTVSPLLAEVERLKEENERLVRLLKEHLALMNDVDHDTMDGQYKIRQSLDRLETLI